VSLQPAPLSADPPSLRRSDDPALDGALYTARVDDTRPLTGEAASSPRVVGALPFSDKGDTSKFRDDYSCQAQVGALQGGWLFLVMFESVCE
jgi:hypothetical protein